MKLSFIGCGKVGATVAFTACLRGLANQIVMIDAFADKAQGEALDITQCRAFMPQADISAGTFADSAESDIVVISAGIPRKADEPRVMLLSRNAALIADLVKQAVKYSPNCILFMVTNPLDIMTDLALKVSGFPPSRVIGMGTVLDTARYRSYIAEEFGFDSRDIDAYVIGEHGETMVPLKSNITVKGIPLSLITEDAAERVDRIAEEVVAASGKVIALKGGTVFAPAASACAVLEAIILNSRRILPVCTYHQQYGVSFSMPTLIGREGAYQTLPIDLSDGDKECLEKSIQSIKSSCNQLSDYIES
ncbi:MAG: L-lactate dehydrogenase [Anaerosporomusa subterranea]|jgi:L-lactate dehydrogenase|nr:L-lactate dehydrogenase [Anaerosporomusa subterranea]